MEDIKTDDKLEAAAREYDDSLLQDDNLSESDCTLRDFKAGSAWKEKEMQVIIEKAKKWDDHCSSCKNVKELPQICE